MGMLKAIPAHLYFTHAVLTSLCLSVCLSVCTNTDLPLSASAASTASRRHVQHQLTASMDTA